MSKIFNASKFYSLLEWIMWLAYLNLLWMGGLAAGLFVLGLFPATVSMFAVIRGLLKRDSSENKIFHTFVSMYKKEFVKSNLIGFIVAAMGLVLYLDFLFIQNMSGVVYYILFTGLIFISLVYVISLLYIVPVYVHYDLSFFQYFRHAVLIGIVSPVITLLMLAGLAGLYLLLVSIPGLIPFITTSSVAFILMSSALIVFHRLEQKQRMAVSN
ncbi:YesL family protein [Domibacillus enclensis]|uniref:Uncharacterized membrane protein YesL n=1 Tax=Domibacillus enclensis TaxID=1017273 RepID=A0A1N6RSV2_9BACI|nr:DUF624 domain-containing protein [Domibacillus enclensis]OXS79132.1 hypothetical protein B1B05_04975 [Domibacillus enclensis]SIQ31861.1 Uncharacterized membrane protein YesL [Domibacillus enclensis]